MTLIDRLQMLARIWAQAQNRSLSRLATIVAKDGKFFVRLEKGKTCTVAIFERFLDFFREPGNWPEECIPADAAALLDEVEMIATGHEPHVGKEMQISGLELMLSPSAAAETDPLPNEEADSHPRPFPLSSQTCLATSARRPSLPESPACSDGADWPLRAAQ
jgi:hypothetical protein